MKELWGFFCNLKGGSPVVALKRKSGLRGREKWWLKEKIKDKECVNFIIWWVTFKNKREKLPS